MSFGSFKVDRLISAVRLPPFDPFRHRLVPFSACSAGHTCHRPAGRCSEPIEVNTDSLLTYDVQFTVIPCSLPRACPSAAHRAGRDRASRTSHRSPYRVQVFFPLLVAADLPSDYTAFRKFRSAANCSFTFDVAPLLAPRLLRRISSLPSGLGRPDVQRRARRSQGANGRNRAGKG